MSESIEMPKYPPVWFVNLYERVRVFFSRMSKKNVPPGLVLFEMIQDFWVAQCIYVVAELNIADLLRDKEKSIEELADVTKTNKTSLYRVMRALSSKDIFKETTAETFTLTPLSKGLLDGPGSWKHLILHHGGPTNWQMFGELLYCVKTGKNSADKVLGMGIFEFLEKNPEKNETFNKSMTNSSNIASTTVVSAYNF